MLLLAMAGLAAPERGSEEWRCAVEVVEACGRLPMAVAIAGGIVNNYGSLDGNLVETIQETLKSDGAGSTVEERVTCFCIAMFF